MTIRHDYLMLALAIVLMMTNCLGAVFSIRKFYARDTQEQPPKKPTRDAYPSVVNCPPIFAGRLLFFILPSDRFEEIIGNFSEIYTDIRSQRGVIFAQLWYWAQVIRVSISCLRVSVIMKTIHSVFDRRS